MTQSGGDGANLVECRSVARTLPAGVDVLICIDPKAGGRRVRVRSDFDPALVKSVRIVVEDVDASDR